MRKRGNLKMSKYMKKIAIILAAAVAAISVASCQKEYLAEQNTEEIRKEKTLKLNVSVTDIAASTKAVKSGWESGDRINIWYGSNNGVTTPDLVIKYNGTKWEVDGTASVSGNSPASEGTLKALYESNNDIAAHFNSREYCTDYISFRGTNSYAAPLMVAASNVAYTYAESTLSCTIGGWEFLTPVQIVVKGLDSANASNYMLQISDFYYPCGITISSSRIDAMTYSGSGRWQLGAANQDGVAFYMKNIQEKTYFTFYLMDRSAQKKYSYTISGKSLAKNYNTLAAISLDFSKFSLAGAIVDGIAYTFSGTSATVIPTNELDGKNVNSYSGSITIPATVTFGSDTYNVKSLGQSAFDGCSSLTSVTLPEGLTSISSYALRNTGISSLTLPASLSSINENNTVFNSKYTDMAISVAEGNTHFSTIDGILYEISNKTKYKLCWVPQSKSGDIVLDANTYKMYSNATLMTTAASSIEFPESFAGVTWGCFQETINDGLTVKFGWTTYDQFKSSEMYTNRSNLLYCFGRYQTQAAKINVSFSKDMSDEDFASIKAVFDASDCPSSCLKSFTRRTE